MASVFEGTWEGTQPIGEGEGFANFCKAMKTEQKLIDEYSKVTMGIKYAVDKATGKWTVSVLVKGDVIKSTEFELGKEFETKGLDGKVYKCETTMNGCESEESAVPTDGSSPGTKTKRSIKDDIMTVKSWKADDETVFMLSTMKRK
ncbi:uncharacterized protein LOC110450263 [Mizuhopecten yessoensis]|uniref:Uncharacterized protein n=1 Tax=Mizuhopecten yessoensis TaxID=6573 RepID=A0A210QPE9_MIZYE|nr:uncharacterized protein LOC110450263 [Mizuhopecten yessoensis]OWF50578.1 hypothetical protein KP79_PYT18293 [Mizuhopecten yessoensis]